LVWPRCRQSARRPAKTAGAPLSKLASCPGLDRAHSSTSISANPVGRSYQSRRPHSFPTFASDLRMSVRESREDTDSAQRKSGAVSRTSKVICPSGGLLTGVSSLISGFPKDISVPTYPKSDLELFASRPTEGAYPDRQRRGMGCGGRGSVLRAMDGRAS